MDQPDANAFPVHCLLPPVDEPDHNESMARNPTPPLWATGGFTLKITGNGSGERRVAVNRPFAVLGRARGNDLIIQDPAVSGRHVYFHLDRRGVFAVDLATRTGSRIGPESMPWAWLDDGDALEVAGFRVELVEWHLDDAEPAPESEPSCPLDDAGESLLAKLTLYPETTPSDPLTLDSRLVFAGRSSACGVPIDCTPAMRVHCVLIRGRTCGYVVDLVGRGTWRNNSPVKRAEPLHHGDTLMIGTVRFQCRVESPGSRANLPAISLGVGSSAITTFDEAAFVEEYPSPPLHLIPAESQAAVLGWMLGQIQARQDESNRRQNEFQTELVRLVAEIHRDNQSMLVRHFERSEEIQEEVFKLREEIMKRFVDMKSSPGSSSTSLPSYHPPKPPPLKKVPPVATPETPEAAVNWLIARAGQLEQENRKGWKDLLNRLSGRKNP